jgi:hypothetical protein
MPYKTPVWSNLTQPARDKKEDFITLTKEMRESENSPPTTRKKRACEENRERLKQHNSPN